MNYKHIGEKLREFRERQGLNQKDFALSIGMGQPNYSRIEGGSVELTQKALLKIIDLYGLNPSYLYLTDAPMTIGEVPSPAGVFVGASEDMAVSYTTKQDLVAIRVHELKAGEKQPLNVRAIPVYDIRASAGITEVIMPQHITPDNLVYMPEFSACDFVAHAYGESMEPVIMNGDMIVCRTLHRLSDLNMGKVYMVEAETGIYIKYVYRQQDALILTSENKAFAPIMVPIAEVRKLHEVVWTVRVRKV